MNAVEYTESRPSKLLSYALLKTDKDTLFAFTDLIECLNWIEAINKKYKYTSNDYHAIRISGALAQKLAKCNKLNKMLFAPFTCNELNPESIKMFFIKTE